MKILFFGDIYGKAGRQTVFNALPALKEQFQPDFIIANGENLADGKGLTEKTANPMFSAGIDALTGGNHLWDRAESLEYLRNNLQIVKPMNYPESTPGCRYCVLRKEELKLGIINLCGQIFMPPCDNPFTTLQRFLEVHDPHIPLLLDFHAESTSEKRAMAWFADGKVSALLGTHTHIQTADEVIMPQGMAYITDVGMTGAHDSVIGVQKEIIINKLLSCVPSPYKSSDLGLQVNAVLCEISEVSGKASSIKRIQQQVSISE